jgi:hypothetical protein
MVFIVGLCAMHFMGDLFDFKRRLIMCILQALEKLLLETNPLVMITSELSLPPNLECLSHDVTTPFCCSIMTWLKEMESREGFTLVHTFGAKWSCGS